MINKIAKMKSLALMQRYFVRKLKVVPRQSWIERPSDAYIPFNERKIEIPGTEIKYYRDVKKQIKQQIKQQLTVEISAIRSRANINSNQQQGQVDSKNAKIAAGQSTSEHDQIQACISPKLGPYTVKNPNIYNKKYRWCSCGQSLNQPFCDNSHKGSQFRPLKFTIQQNVKQVQLCGCKLTSKKPFCDGIACVSLRAKSSAVQTEKTINITQSNKQKQPRKQNQTHNQDEIPSKNLG